MYISLSLLFLFIGSTSTKKHGDFGSLTACLIDDDLRLTCSYGNCTGSPPFQCEFMPSNGFPPANSSNMCKIIIKRHRLLYRDKITNYTCILTRKLRKEQKDIFIDYSIRTGRTRIKKCPATAGLLLHRAPTLLWPVVILSLWRVLGTDSHTT